MELNPKFEKRYYQKKFGGIFDRKLFTWKELENLINIRPLMTNNRVLHHDGREYEWENSLWSLDVNCYTPSLMSKLVKESGVCTFIDMSRASEKINAFAKQLEIDYNKETDAHIYTCMNIEAEHPFGSHWDLNDNVIVQCEGVTNFKVWEKIPEGWDGAKVHLNLIHKPLLDVEMKPGDAIWIPRYHPHLATSRTSRMSVSFCQSEGTNYQDREWVKL